MTISKEQAADFIESEGGSEVLRQMFNGENDPFDADIQDPYHVFNDGAPQLEDSFVPLFEIGSFTYCYDRSRSLYLAFDLESIDAEHRYGRSINCLWAGIMLNYYDDETTLDDVMGLSARCGYPYARELHDTMQRHMSGAISYEEAETKIFEISEG